MKVLTLKQPWASLIVNGYKEYAFKLENIKKVKPVFTKGKLSFWEYCEDNIKVL